MAQQYGADKRKLFETDGSRLFEDIAARGGVPHDDPLIKGNPESVELLFELGLLRRDGMRYLVVDPHSVQDSIVTPLGQQGAQMISESSHWANAFNTLGQAYRRSGAEIMPEKQSGDLNGSPPFRSPSRGAGPVRRRGAP